MFHHHLHPFPEFIQTDENSQIGMDLSIIRDSGIVERQLERMKFDLILHGHKHKPQIRETVRKSSIARRESIAEKIESALQDAEAKKVAVGGAARGGVQQVINGRDGQNKLFGEGSLDVTFLVRPMARTTLFVDLEAIAGPGPDRRLGSLSRVNADAETLGGQDEKLTAREVWLGLRFINDRLDFFVGKLDPTNYFDRNAFANDETSQFLNAALVNNPMLKQPPNGPGAVVRWDVGRDLSLSLGAHAPNDLGHDLAGGPYGIGEIDFHSARFIDSFDAFARRATAVVTAVQAPKLRLELLDGESLIGGGAAPSSVLPTCLIGVTHPDFSADELSSRLRANDPPIVARVEEGRILLDLRTVFPQQETTVVAALASLN